jgi:hypothetical protein
MPVSVQWDDPEKTLIYARYERWSWDDFYKALNDCMQLSHTVDHPVDIICDLVDNMVPKGATISHAAATMRLDTTKGGLVVLVTSNHFIQSLIQVSSRVIPGFQKRYRLTSTLSSARELIVKERQKRTTITP